MDQGQVERKAKAKKGLLKKTKKLAIVGFKKFEGVLSKLEKLGDDKGGVSSLVKKKKRFKIGNGMKYFVKKPKKVLIKGLNFFGKKPAKFLAKGLRRIAKAEPEKALVKGLNFIENKPIAGLEKGLKFLNGKPKAGLMKGLKFLNGKPKAGLMKGLKFLNGKPKAGLMKGLKFIEQKPKAGWKKVVKFMAGKPKRVLVKGLNFMAGKPKRVLVKGLNFIINKPVKGNVKGTGPPRRIPNVDLRSRGLNTLLHIPKERKLNDGSDSNKPETKTRPRIPSRYLSEYNSDLAKEKRAQRAKKKQGNAYQDLEDNHLGELFDESNTGKETGNVEVTDLEDNHLGGLFDESNTGAETGAVEAKDANKENEFNAGKRQSLDWDDSAFGGVPGDEAPNEATARKERKSVTIAEEKRKSPLDEESVSSSSESGEDEEDSDNGERGSKRTSQVGKKQKTQVHKKTSGNNQFKTDKWENDLKGAANEVADDAEEAAGGLDDDTDGVGDGDAEEPGDGDSDENENEDKSNLGKNEPEEEEANQHLGKDLKDPEDKLEGKISDKMDGEGGSEEDEVSKRRSLNTLMEGIRRKSSTDQRNSVNDTGGRRDSIRSERRGTYADGRDSFRSNDNGRRRSRRDSYDRYDDYDDDGYGDYDDRYRGGRRDSRFRDGGRRYSSDLAHFDDLDEQCFCDNPSRHYRSHASGGFSGGYRTARRGLRQVSPDWFQVPLPFGAGGSSTSPQSIQLFYPPGMMNQSHTSLPQHPPPPHPPSHPSHPSYPSDPVQIFLQSPPSSSPPSPSCPAPPHCPSSGQYHCTFPALRDPSPHHGFAPYLGPFPDPFLLASLQSPWQNLGPVSNFHSPMFKQTAPFQSPLPPFYHPSYTQSNPFQQYTPFPSQSGPQETRETPYPFPTMAPVSPASFQSPLQSPLQSPFQSPLQSPFQSPLQSPVQSPPPQELLQSSSYDEPRQSQYLSRSSSVSRPSFSPQPPPSLRNSLDSFQPPRPSVRNSLDSFQPPPPSLRNSLDSFQPPPPSLRNSLDSFQPPPPSLRNSLDTFQPPPPSHRNSRDSLQPPSPSLRNSLDSFQPPPPPSHRNSRDSLQPPPPSLRNSLNSLPPSIRNSLNSLPPSFPSRPSLPKEPAEYGQEGQRNSLLSQPDLSPIDDSSELERPYPLVYKEIQALAGTNTVVYFNIQELQVGYFDDHNDLNGQSISIAGCLEPYINDMLFFKLCPGYHHRVRYTPDGRRVLSMETIESLPCFYRQMTVDEATYFITTAPLYECINQL